MSYVYFIYEQPTSPDENDLELSRIIYQYPLLFTNVFKIGESTNPLKRLKTLQTGNKRTLFIYKTIKCPNKTVSKQLERWLHLILKEKRQGGEWFKITFEEIDILHSICQEDILKMDSENNSGKHAASVIKSNFGIPLFIC